MATILTKTHSIINKSMLIAKDFLSVGLSSQKNFHYSQHASPTVILREAEGEVAESTSKK